MNNVDKRPFLAPEYSINFPFNGLEAVFSKGMSWKAPEHVHILHTDSTKCIIALFESTAFLLLAISLFHSETGFLVH